MRLLKSEGRLQLVNSSPETPDTGYAILSHRWLPQASEVTYGDIRKLTGKVKPSNTKAPDDDDVEYGSLCENWPTGLTFEDSSKAESWHLFREQSVKKLRGFRNIAASNKHKYIWLDTCCIDQSNPVELSRAINSMYRWYENAERCYVYLYDFDTTDESSVMAESDWFTRGWTLQELVAPQAVEFFDRNWNRIGLIAKNQEKRSAEDQELLDIVAVTTGISKQVLLKQAKVSDMSVAHRMSWFGNRATTEPEDSAYCLQGLFGVSMPTIPGEGLASAFRRLQEEILRRSDDHSLFAWELPSDNSAPGGMLAPSPTCFARMGKYGPRTNPEDVYPYQMTNKGLSIHLSMLELRDKTFIAPLNCSEDGSDNYLGIWLGRNNTVRRQYSRIRSHQTCEVARPGPLQQIYVAQP